VRLARADVGIALDGDFDRCLFFDEEGASSTATTSSACSRAPSRGAEGAPIVHDPRLVWNTQQIVREKGGRPAVQVRPRLHEALHARGG
jgi:phosphomannomutase